MSIENIQMTADEVAGLLGISKGQVYNWCRAGILPHYRNGRDIVFIRPEIVNFKAGSLPRNGHKSTKPENALAWKQGYIAGRFDQLCDDIKLQLTAIADLLKEGGNA